VIRILSVHMAVSLIRREMDLHPEGSTIGVGAPPLSDTDLLVKDLVSMWESMSETRVLTMSAGEFLQPGDWLQITASELESETGRNLHRADRGLEWGDSLYVLLDSFCSARKRKIFMIVDSIEELPRDKQYVLAAQLRDFREKAKVSPIGWQFHSVIVGRFSIQALKEQARRRGGSLPCDLTVFLGPADLRDFERDCERLCGLNAGSVDTKPSLLQLAYLHELTKGCWGLAQLVLQRTRAKPDCDQLLHAMEDQVAASEEFLDTFRDSLLASAYARSLLPPLLGGRRITGEIDDTLLEEVLLTGVFLAHHEGAGYQIEIRSWAHEVALRRFVHAFITDTKIVTEASQIIPPSSVLNRRAYALILQCENELRNLVVSRLAELLSDKQHPLTALDVLGYIKELDRKHLTIHQYCELRREELSASESVDAHPSLSSYLGMSDLLDLLTDSATNKNDGYRKGMYSLVASIFPDRTALKDLLTRLRDVRNPVAHNNLITERTVLDLERWVAAIRQHLTVPPTLQR
jgi:hypothetical protein